MRPHLRSAAVLAVSVLMLASCASVVSGTGTGSGEPTSGSSSPTSPTSSTSSTSSRSPSSSSPTGFPSAAAIPDNLRRTPVRTVIGDPVTADVCTTLGLGFLKPLGLPRAFLSVRYAAGCTFRTVKGTATQIGVTVLAYTPSSVAKRPARGIRTINGLRVYVGVLDTGFCVRDIYLSGITVEVEGYALGAPKTSRGICRAADLATARFTRLVATHSRFAPLPLPSSSVFDADMCKIANKAGVGDAALLANTKQTSYYLGAECYYSGARVYAYFDVATYRPASNMTKDGRPVTTGSHTLYADVDNSSTRCVLRSPQDALTDGSGVAALVIEFDSQTGKAIPSLCTKGLAITGRFLDAAGLK